MAKRGISGIATQPQIFAASLGFDGAVMKGAEITQAEAEELRQTGSDVVVCGPDISANRALAELIEKNANGRFTRCAPHLRAGTKALPHYQPKSRPPAGHSFYETPNRKAQ